MIVVDASALLEVLLRTDLSHAIETALFDSNETLHAPHLIDIEVTQVLRRYLAAGNIAENRGREAISDLGDFPIFRYSHGLLLPRVWQLRNNMTAYDAAYVALAETLDAKLVTRDQRIAAAPGHTAHVQIV